MKTTTKVVTGVSAAGALAITALIVPSESIVLRTYRDPIGILTYCAGETEGAVAGRTYTLDQCMAILRKRVARFETSISACLPGYSSLPLETAASVVSITYNVGEGAMCKSTLFRKLRLGDIRGACDEFPKWNRAGGRVLKGLVKRRAMERAWCLKGIS